ncbi:MAG: DUF4286 family protein [Flavisolibacter sp.]
MNEIEVNIIYNVTVKPELQVADKWLQWLINVHIPEMLETKCFFDYRLVRLIEVDESEGPTYAVQYYARSKSDYNRYMELFASALRKKNLDKWGQQVLAFTTVMEVVQ